MRFFEDCRAEIYWHGAKLRRDKKTGRRLWGLTLIITLTPELVLKCDEVIEQAYAYMLTLNNQADEVLLGAIAQWMSIDFFGVADDAKAGLHLAGVDLGGLRMTRDGQTVEFWFQLEVENNPKLHAFVKEYAFTRLWAEFKPRAEEIEAEQAATKAREKTLAFAEGGEIPATAAPAIVGERLFSEDGAHLANDPAFLAAADRLASTVRKEGVTSLTISTPGMEPVVIDKAAAEKIYIAAKKKK